MQSRALVPVAFVVLLLTGCGDDDGGGPMDGTWQVTSLSCDGMDATQIPQMTLNVDNTSGTFVLGFGPDCVATIDETYSYPDGETVSITPTGITCDPNGGCAAVFGADCLPTPPATDFAYVVSGNTLTFTKTSGGPPADNCPAGAQNCRGMKRTMNSRRIQTIGDSFHPSVGFRMLNLKHNSRMTM